MARAPRVVLTMIYLNFHAFLEFVVPRVPTVIDLETLQNALLKKIKRLFESFSALLPSYR
jgi:hypothetical protein